MPEKKTIKKAKRDLREGKSGSTAAGEFVHEEIEHVRKGKHGARSAKQAIAIGLSKARRAGIPLKPPPPAEAGAGSAGQTRARRSPRRVSTAAQGKQTPTRARGNKRSAAAMAALKREPKSVVSTSALSRQAKTSAAARRKAATPRRGAESGAKRPAQRQSTSAP